MAVHQTLISPPVAPSTVLSARNPTAVQSRTSEHPRRAGRHRWWPFVFSGACHVLLLAFLGLVTLRMDRDGADRRAEFLIDTTVQVREDFFESRGWTFEAKPQLKQPGGGPLRAALEAKPGDPAPKADGGKGNGLGAGLANPADLISPGGNSTGSGLGAADGIGGGGGEGVGVSDFFGIVSKGKRFVYVIDRSASMAENAALEFAKTELLQIIDRLASTMEFQIVFYNTEPRLLEQAGKGMIPATPLACAKARQEVLAAEPGGGTDHVKAMRTAIGLRPDVIYLLTDADNLTLAEIAELSRLNQSRAGRKKPATINVVQFHHEGHRSPEKTIQKLAEQNKGSYRLIDTNRFVRDH